MQDSVPSIETCMTRPGPRVVLYSHDTMGIGHMRRNLLLAQTLRQGPNQANVLMVAGAPEACAMTASSGIDCLALPALAKNEQGEYTSRHNSMSYRSILQFRSRTIRAAVQAFEPDVLIVDKVPRGIGGELTETLAALKLTDHTRCILGLRDVLDDRTTVQREWCEADGDAAIRDFYDGVWVYGDRSVFATMEESGFDATVIEKSYYTGYLNQRARLSFNRQNEATTASDIRNGLHEPLILAVLGGGQDGAALSRVFCQSHLPEGTQGILLTGPCMPECDRIELHKMARANGQIRVIDTFIEADVLIEAADRVIGMGGYNTVCSVLSFNRPALIVPRVQPRREQLIRAQRLAAAGWIDYLHPDCLSADALTFWMHSDVSGLTLRRRSIDLNGLDRIDQLLGQLISGRDLQPVSPSPFPAPSEETTTHVL